VATQLWLLRHGEAEPHGDRPDAERRLTRRGEDQARAAGRALAALDVRFHLAFTSPRVRALDTARFALEALGNELVVHEPLGGDFEADEALVLAASGGDDQRTLLVGHNPDFEQVIHDLTGAQVDLKKGGIAGIRLTGTRRGELVALLRPREIDRLAEVPTA
jgi:phosphohistidine phosphatase